MIIIINDTLGRLQVLMAHISPTGPNHNYPNKTDLVTCITHPPDTKRLISFKCTRFSRVQVRLDLIVHP